MMLDPARLVVLTLYAATLALVWLVPHRFTDSRGKRARWWQNVRVWASLVILVQMYVYATWG